MKLCVELTVSLRPLEAASVSDFGAVVGQNRIGQRSPLWQTAADLQSLFPLRRVELPHVCKSQVQQQLVSTETPQGKFKNPLNEFKLDPNTSGTLLQL